VTLSDLEHFRSLLLEKEQNLSEWIDSMSDARGDDVHKVHALLDEIKDALKRVEHKTYGVCEICKGEVEHHRLEVQPATEVCLACISDKEKATLEEELFIASKIHRALLPRDIPAIDGFDLAVKSLAAHGVGGDYYDFLRNDNGIVKVIIADSMGKGLPAGLLMSNLQGALRILAETIESPSQLITRLNQWISRNIPVTKFITLECVAIEPGPPGKPTRIVHTNAGHWPSIIVRNDNSVERLDPTGVVLGIGEDFSYDEQECNLNSGDVLVLFTDGVSEAENPSGEMFGEDRLIEYMRSHRTDSFDLILTDLVCEVEQFTDCSKLQDDLTVIALRKK
jgi:sigma-B regulation protein RsbU (phosphoserine phosphatase)